MNSSTQYKKGIREQYATNIKLLDAAITHYMAKPLPGQIPYFKPSARRSFWLSVIGLICFPSLVLLVSQLSFWAAVIASYFAAVAMTGLFRKFQVEFGHHASHCTFIRGNRKANQLYLNLATTFAFCQNGDEYKKDHNEHHDREIFTTEHDADAVLLRKFGICPGKSKAMLWLPLFANLVSPLFHIYFLLQRAKSNFITRRGIVWKLASLAWISFIVSTIFILPTWIAVVTIILPITLFYQMSALCQFATEHAWLVTKDAPSDNRIYASRCWGRFAGEALPKNPKSLKAFILDWPSFIIRHLFLHFPTRYAIIVGDMPAHDWHHLAAYMGVSGHNWPAGIYERQRAIERDDCLDMADRELWGIYSMLGHIFTILASVNEKHTFADNSITDEHSSSIPMLSNEMSST